MGEEEVRPTDGLTALNEETESIHENATEKRHSELTTHL